MSSEIPSPYTLLFKRKVKAHLPGVHFSTVGNVMPLLMPPTNRNRPPIIDPETDCWFQKTLNSSCQQAKVVATRSDRKHILQATDGAQFQRDHIHVRPSAKPSNQVSCHRGTLHTSSSPHPQQEI